MEILREARPPRPRRNPRRGYYYLAALFIGLGLGTILFFGQILAGTFLIIGSVWLLFWVNEGDRE